MAKFQVRGSKSSVARVITKGKSVYRVTGQQRGAPGSAGANGAPGAPGADGAAGPGVASGGTLGQVLRKSSNLDYETVWGDPDTPQIIVATADSPANWKAVARFVCDGVADDVELQLAINESLAAGGGSILLAPGTFAVSQTLQVVGVDDVDAQITLFILGTGKNSSTLVGAEDTDVIHLGQIIKVSFHDFGIDVHGSGSGITSQASASAVQRSFWDSAFINLHIGGDWATHTGWAMNLGSPFRSIFENIEIGGVGNGIRLYSEYDVFNPGDCVFTRVFVELASSGPGIAYQLDSPTGLGSVNQINFNMCEAIAGMAGCTGIQLIGATGSNFNRFWGTNMEQMLISVDVQTGEGNIFELDYTQPTDGGTFFHCGATTQNNVFSSVDAFVEAPVSGATLFHDEGVSDSAPNRMINTKILANNGDLTMSIADGTVLRDNVVVGAEVVPAYVDHWIGTLKMAVASNQSTRALEIVNDSGGGGGAVDTVYIHDETNFAYANALILLELKNASDTGQNLRLKTAATANHPLEVVNGSNAVKMAIKQDGTLFLPTGAANTYVLTSDASGNASWAAAASGGLTNPMTAIGDLIQGTTAGAPARLASVATGNVLISGGVTTASSWGKVGLTTHVTGTLGVGNGGTGITALGTGVATALGINVGSAGAPVVLNGAGGTPSAITLTNGTGLPIAGLTASTATALGVGTVELGHASDTTLSRSSAGVLAVEGVTVAMNSTSAVHTAGTIELGAASDTTIARSGAGAITVEGVQVALNSTSLVHTASSIELGAATDTTLSRSAAGVLAVEGVVIPSISSTNTLTNKRITLRTGTTASSGTPTINTDNVDAYIITAQAAAITSFTTNLSGTPTEGQLLLISITDNGTARALTFGASFEASGTVALPTTTVISTRLDILFIWNVVTSKWRCLAVS